MKKQNSTKRKVLLFSYLWIVSLGMFAQNITVTGTVRDANNEPVIGATIVEVGNTSHGTVSDIDGNYVLTNIPVNASLQFSYVGMQPQVVIVNGRTTINVLMASDSELLEELVVVGYGTQRKQDLTGSVVRADLNSFRESPNVNLMQSLQGSVPGLNVGAVTSAGGNPSISIRGQNSISGSNSPLIVLDGIIYRGNLVDINPTDISSIDILKDASAAAIYGSQSTNGVILITSKSGTYGEEKPKVSYSASYALQQISNNSMLPLDADGWIEFIGNRFLNESRIGDDMLTKNPDWDPTTKFYSGEVLTGYQDGVNNDWWNLLTNQNPIIANHNISISGGGQANSYFLSYGYTDQQNVVKNDNYQRHSLRLNLDSKLTDWMKLGVQSFLSLNDYSGVSPNISDAIRMPPQINYKDEEGEYIVLPFRGVVNPLLIEDQQDLNKHSTLFGNFYLDINVPFIKGLNYRVNYSHELVNSKRYNFNKYGANQTGSGYKNNSERYAYTLDNIFNYRNTFGKNEVTGTFVYGVEETNYESTSAASEIFTNMALGYNKLDAGQADQQKTGSSAWKETSVYQMLRLGYTFDNRYLFTGTIRRDGFSGFGPDNKYSIFPSIAFGWRLTEESFFQNINRETINDLKLRLSYGLNGNRTVGRYETLPKMDSSFGNGYLYGDGASAEIGQYMSSLPNSNLKWETTASFNTGIDFSLIDNRLFGSLDLYWSNTYDLLYNINIPRINGFSSIASNIGEMKNSGQEFTLTGIPITNKDFNWNITFNFSRNRNKVVSILGIDADGDGKEDDLVSSKIFIDHPYGVAYDFNIIGMWQLDDYRQGNIPNGFTYGSYKVEDINGDGNYTASQDRKILGYTSPSYRFSIMNSLSYKNWELKLFLNSIQGGKDYYYGQPGSSLPNPDNIYTWNTHDFDYWTPENPNSRYRQTGHYTVALGENFSPYVQRSFIRLQDVSLSYNLPKKFIDKIQFSNINLFISGKNLLTISDWDGWDPETGTGLDAGAYPLLKSYSIGVNIDF